MGKTKKTVEEAEVMAVMKALPTIPPEGTIHELNRRGYLTKEVMLYEKDYIREPLTGMKSTAVKTYCTACGGTAWYTYVSGGGCTRYGYQPYGFRLEYGDTETDVTQGNEISCPMCDNKVVAIRKGSFDYVRTIDSVYICHILNVAGHLVAVSWLVRKTVDKRGKTDYEYTRDEATAIIDGRLFRYCGHKSYMGNVYNSYGGWEVRKEQKDRIEQINRSAILFDTGVENSTDSEKCAITDYLYSVSGGVKCTPGAYLQLWCKHPNVENLARQGLGAYVQEVMNNCYEGAVNCYGYTSSQNTNTFHISKTDKYINWKEVKPQRMIGLEKDELALAKDRDIKFASLQFYKLAKSVYGVRLSYEQLIFIGGLNKESLYSLARGEFHGFIPPIERMVNYLKKQTELLGPSVVNLSYLRDYWDSVYKVYGQMEPSMLWPSDLRRAHDSMLNRVKYKEDEDLKVKFKNRAKELKPLSFVCPELGLEIRPVRSQAELIREGDKLHHCVARYARDHANGNTAILLIRRSEAKGEPYYTLEWKNGQIQQDHGDHNKLQTEEIFAFEKKWLAHVASLKGVNKNGKQATECIRTGA